MSNDYEVIGHDAQGNEIIEGEIINDEQEVAEEVSDYWKSVAYHLQNNLTPPVPLAMVDTCISAIAYANEGEWDSLIELPEGIKYKGESEATVEVIVDSHYLQDFITTAREVVMIKDEEGNVIYQGYGTEIKLEPTTPITDENLEDFGIEK
jgi:hypothetical protein